MFQKLTTRHYAPHDVLTSKNDGEQHLNYKQINKFF